MHIRTYSEEDWPSVWSIIEPVFRAGETYAFPLDINEADARGVWVELPQATFVALDDDGVILGTYYIKPNQAGPGSHICNCGYIVAEAARGRGVASALCRHSQTTALELGFRAMQYNCVVATNESAIRLWKKLGFQIIGVLPEAYQSRSAGYVDALVMFKTLRT